MDWILVLTLWSIGGDPYVQIKPVESIDQCMQEARAYADPKAMLVASGCVQAVLLRKPEPPKGKDA